VGSKEAHNIMALQGNIGSGDWLLGL